MCGWWQPMNYTGVALLLNICLHTRKDGTIHMSSALQVCCENRLTAGLCILWGVHTMLWIVMCGSLISIGLDVGKLKVVLTRRLLMPMIWGLILLSRAAHFCTMRSGGLACETTLIQTQYEWTLGKCDHHVQTINNSSPFPYKAVRLDAYAVDGRSAAG